MGSLSRSSFELMTTIEACASGWMEKTSGPAIIGASCAALARNRFEGTPESPTLFVANDLMISCHPVISKFFASGTFANLRFKNAGVSGRFDALRTLMFENRRYVGKRKVVVAGKNG